MTRFDEALQQGVLVADGGMGSMCHQVVSGPIRCVDELCLTRSAKVMGVHLRFIQAGARIIETNSFGANRVKLGLHGLQDEVANINSRAVKLAREAREIAGTDVFIAGSMGPTGLTLHKSEQEAADLLDVFREQALALDDRGVDLFMLETFPTAWEIEQAVRAVRSVSSLPIVAQITFPAVDDWTGDEKILPRWATDAFERLDALGCAAIGANCTLGPGEMLEAVQLMSATLENSAPNSGLPRVQSGRFIYPNSTASYFGWFASEAVRAGARIVGGCCGTTPEHIAAVAAAVKDYVVPEKQVRVVMPPRQITADVDTIDRPTSMLSQRFEAGEFVISMQVDPPKGTNPQMILDACTAFADSGLVHAVDVNSNPMARLHMDALWMSSMIESVIGPAGMETIPHYTPRDSSKMGIEGNLLGAWAAGIRNVLVITGDPSVVAGEPHGHDVYQTDSIGMVEYLANLNRGIDCYGNAIGSPPNFTIGVAVNPAHDDLEVEVERFRAKVAAGAHFAMTQVFFDWRHWERFEEALGGPSPIPILIAVWPLTSHRLALRLHNEVPGIVVPQWLLDKLEAAGSKARVEGRAVARELLQEARNRAQGAYIIAPFKKPRAALKLLG